MIDTTIKKEIYANKNHSQKTDKASLVTVPKGKVDFEVDA